MNAAPETCKLIAELIQKEMGAASGVVQIYNQKRRLPATKGFIVSVAIVGDRPFGVNQQIVENPTTGDVIETATVNSQEMIQVDIFSYDDSARKRRVEILFALGGNACQQLAEKYSFKVGQIPSSFVDVSTVEASTRLNRYAITFNILRVYSRELIIDHFDKFGIPPAITVNP